MSYNTFGRLFRVTTWGESHGPAIGATVDGCPPGIRVDEEMLQHWLDKRKPGQSRYTTPDITYWQKYGIRDYRGGGRSSARETASRVAAGGLARAVLGELLPGLEITGYMVRMGNIAIDRARFDWSEIPRNPFWAPDAQAAREWADYLDDLRKSGSSVGAMIEVVAKGVPPGLGAPVYGKLDTDLAAAMMSINAVKGVEIGAGMEAAMLTGEERGECRRDQDGARWPGVRLQSCRGHPWRHQHRAGCGGALRGKADILDPDTAQDNHQIGRGDGDRHQGAA